MEYQFTAYFENEVLRKRTYLTREACIRVVQHPIASSGKRTAAFDIDGASRKLDLGTIDLPNFSGTTKVFRSAA